MHMWPCMHPKGTYKAFLCTQTPHDACGSPSQFFYSIETGPVHSIFLSNYHDYTTGSDQARRRIPQPFPWQQLCSVVCIAVVMRASPCACCCMVHGLAGCHDLKALQVGYVWHFS